MKSETNNKNLKQIFSNNITKSSKKPNSNFSIFSLKINNNIESRKNKKNELSLNNINKTNLNKKQIITEKREKIPKASNKYLLQNNNNKNNRKNKKNDNNNFSYQNDDNNQVNHNKKKEKILSSKSNIKKNKNHIKSLSISITPDNNKYPDLEVNTSFELLPSEIKTPKTISEDSFILTKKEKEESDNIKVNIKTNESDKNKKNQTKKEEIFKVLNSNKKIRKNKNLGNNHDTFKNNKKNTKVINKNFRIMQKTIAEGIPSLQKSITVKKNRILNISNNKDDKDKIKYNRNMSRSNIENGGKPIQELKKNLSYHSIKFCINQKLAKLKRNNNKNNQNKIIPKIPINSKISDKVEINRDNSLKEDNINKNIENKYNNTENIKNKKKKKEKLSLTTKNKILKNLELEHLLLNNNLKLIKENQNNTKNKNKDENITNSQDIYYSKKNSKITDKNNNNLALNIENSNNIVKINCKQLLKNMSGNNFIYAPKKGINRQKSHEKDLNNIYSNKSHNPNKLKEINKKRDNMKINYKKDIKTEVNNNLEKNNSFWGNLGSLGYISLGNEYNAITPRLNLIDNISKINFDNLKSDNNIHLTMKNNTNKIKQSLDKELEDNNNNNIFMPNRYTTTEKINYNNFFNDQDFDNHLNLGQNLDIDFNNYDINNFGNLYLNKIFNHNSLINRLNIYPENCNFSIQTPFNNNINQTNLINLYNNNYLNFNTIQGRPSHVINYYDLNNPLYQYPNESEGLKSSKKSFFINIEDLIILQEKLKYIITVLNKTHTVENECFEFLNFYYNSSIYCQLEKSFTNPNDSNIVRISTNFALISIIICYDYCFEEEIMIKGKMILSNIIKLNYKNLIVIYEHILGKISIENKNNILVKRLSNIINSYKKIESIKDNNLSKITLLIYNTNIILQNLLLLLNNFRTTRNIYFFNFLNGIQETSYSQINIFFRDYILRTNNLKGSILASVLLRTGNKTFVPVPNPYVRTKNNKNYSLVLDLDETLVHFKEKYERDMNGVLRVRPGVNEFLEEVGKYYELIVFTTATQDYADVLIDAIEEDKIYFEHRFYRNHAIILNNDFVKDLNRIGRPLDKIIIVDNMPQNFRLQKENGIMIKAFWGEDQYDTVLYDLIPILVNIAKDGGDVRKGLVKYKEDILKKISSNISKDM